ncbi:MAG TPA: carboxypeptidase-like regulatory domain-containing protein, partial [Chitinophagales bacterium]|nr:carboxypeptidase-like regulatory domain-containing protein [Chitinophagales bacterium]
MVKKNSLPLLPLLLIIAIIFMSTASFAQTTITGVVLDSITNETLIGANVRLQSDPTIGASTDIDGKFTISSPTTSGAIIISYIGFNTKTITF